MKDTYNFDQIRTFEGDVETFIKRNKGIGNLANDIGLLSQADGVISKYDTYISFQKIITI